MKNVIIYCRVSTDEQALNGYSLPDQREKLQKYCAQKGYNIVYSETEDFSAKTFDRPAFKRVLEFIEKDKRKIEMFLVLKWSRFSRNTYESYKVLDDFKRKDIEINAIEQPIDWSIPQNKYLLAFYLAEPEIDNDIRSKSVVDGMRRANVEGRYLGPAPKGYKNEKDPLGKPILVPDHNAPFITEGFETMAIGAYTQMEVLKLLNAKGFECSKAQFSKLIKNKLYCGQVYVRPNSIEKGYWGSGIHVPLVSEEIYNKVACILSGRQQSQKSLKVKSRDSNLPLRGFLECPGCNRKLTGSKSKGNGGHYYYYHCNECGTRHKAELVNDSLLEELESIEFNDEIKELYLEIIKDKLKGTATERKSEIKKREEEVTKYNLRLDTLFDEKVDGRISMEEYEKNKKRYSERVEILKQELAEIKMVQPEFEKYLNSGFNMLKGVKTHFKTQGIDQQQQIIGSMYPELMTFEDGRLRTGKINEVVQLVATFNRVSRGQTKKTSQLKTNLSRMVPRRRLELPHLAAYAPQAYLYTIPTPGHSTFLTTVRTNTRVIMLQRCELF